MAKPVKFAERSLLGKIGFGAGLAIQSLLLGGVYAPMAFAVRIIKGIHIVHVNVAQVIMQSCVTAIPVIPAEWEETLTGKAWGAGFGVFLALFCIPFVTYAFEPGSDYQALVIGGFLGLLLLMHLGTIYYMSSRPGAVLCD